MLLTKPKTQTVKKTNPAVFLFTATERRSVCKTEYKSTQGLKITEPAEHIIKAQAKATNFTQ